MALRIIFRTARSAVLEITDGGKYNTNRLYEVWVNGAFAKTTDKVITNLFGLQPKTEYHVEVRPAGGPLSHVSEDGTKLAAAADEGRHVVSFSTEYESVTLDIRDFGAVGDGRTDNTLFIQTAFALCPPDGRVLIPKGVYKFRTLLLRSDLNVCLERGAVLSAFTDPEKLPILPGVVQYWNEKEELNPGTWEGNPLPCYTGLVSGYGVKNVLLYGEGIIDGCGSKETWWQKDYVRRKSLPARPRLFFLNRCSHVTVQGLTFTNSPSWTIHPYFSDHLVFYGTNVKNPPDSPNTDGLDPESSSEIRILGMHFSLGDDCIAIKSGKIYMGMRYGTPSSGIQIRHCLLAEGHGSVTIGSEMAGGVNNVLVEDCLFDHTDRGLRIKTRRGRGERAIVDKITFRNITMKGVLTPVVVNCFYFCDPDGHTSYVQDRKPYPVDERTPQICTLTFEHLDCTDCQAQAVWIEGLPEQMVEKVTIKDAHFAFAEDPEPAVPAMAEGVEPCVRHGIFASNVEKLSIRNVTIKGHEGRGIDV